MGDLYDLASDILAAVEDHYLTEGVDLPGRRYVTDGLPAWDCDQVTVRVTRTFGIAGDVRVEAASILGPLVLTAADVEVQVVRCAPTVDDSGDPPAPEAIADSAEAVLNDADLVRAALLEAYKAGDLGGCQGAALLGWTPAGPEGGLVGGATLVRLDLA